MTTLDATTTVSNDGLNSAGHGLDGRLEEVPTSKPLFSAREQELLNAYDRFEQIRWETALLRAHQVLEKSPAHDSSPDAFEEDLRVAEKEVLEAKAAYSIRKQAVEAVASTSAMEEAVAPDTQSSTIREWKGYGGIRGRDEISFMHGELLAELSSLRGELTTTEIEHIQLTERNAALAEELLRLTEAQQRRSRVEIEDPVIRSQVEELQGEVRRGRLKWRIIKSVVSAMVAGSGVDWASDETLRELVLDDEDDEI